jgi:hypothetical protein
MIWVDFPSSYLIGGNHILELSASSDCGNDDTVASENVYTSATKKISTAQQSPKSTQLNHA